MKIFLKVIQDKSFKSLIMKKGWIRQKVGISDGLEKNEVENCGLESIQKAIVGLLEDWIGTVERCRSSIEIFIDKSIVLDLSTLR